MKKRKASCLLFAALLFLSLTACTSEQRIDRNELALSLEKIDKAYSFTSQEVIIKEGEQCIFFSLHKTDDCLLTLYPDEGQNIQSISLSLDRSVWSGGDIKTSFLPFCLAVLSVLCSDEEIIQAAVKDLELEKTETFNENHFKSTEHGKFNFSVYVNDLSYVFEWGYV